jgi:hypothetical protein
MHGSTVFVGIAPTHLAAVGACSSFPFEGSM